MKRTRKLILALVVVMSLLMAMAVAIIPANAAGEQPEYLFLKPNSNWTKDNARFAAYFFGNGETWVDMVKTTNGYYAVKVPTNKVYPKVIFCRMNPNGTNGWTANTQKWNQTGDLTVPTDGTNLYTVKDNTWDKGGGSWSKGACDKVGHIFKDGKCTTCEFAGVVFLKPNSNWLADNARFAINLCNGASNAWVSMTDNGDDLYTATIPDGNYTNIIFVRMNPSTTDNNWDKDNKWNQTADLLLSGNNNLFTVPSESWDGATTTWSHYCYGGTATCTEKAVCTACGEKYGEALGHDWDDATCTAPKTCSVCGATEGGPVHATVTHVASKAATCTENGNIEYWYCEACGQAWLDEDCRFNTNLLAVVLPMTNHLENCPHKAVVGGTYYETLQQAIAGATAGSVIVLRSDIEIVGDLPIENQVTINLNGKTLTAGAVVTFYEGTKFIGEGKLEVAKNSLYNIKGETDYVPVWNAPVLGENDEVVTPGYYTFSEVKDQIKESTVEGTEVVVFRPAFENKEIKKEFVDGAGDNGLSFVISITWEGLAKPKEYTLTDDFIANVYNAENPKAIQLGFENWQAGVEYTVTLRIVSGGIYYETTLCTMKDGAITVPEIVTE